MMFPYYCVFQNGQSVARQPSAFKLHNTRAEFETAPRVFTSFVAERNSSNEYHTLGWALHIERLLTDSRAFDLLDLAQPESNAHWIRNAVGEFFKSVGPEAPAELRVRLLKSRELLELNVEPYRPRWEKGSAIALVTFRGERSWPEQKTTATETSVASHEYAAAHDAQEALLIDELGLVREGSWSNFFWFDSGGALYTRETDVLPGVTRKLLCRHFPVRFQSVTPAALKASAVEAFIAQSSAAITPVARIDDWPLSGGAPGPYLSALLARWNEIVSPESESLTGDLR